ncbi:hypothetical protein [Ancylobacter sp. G4_0304]|uniref:hypothetical protein n=1 Tax=Ancylobacter sp. G4_0304 TaxID=3114289 RepID=UPI0039C6B614
MPNAVTARGDAVEPMASHPEEMKAVYELQVGNWISVRCSARVTPAGIIAVGIGASAVALACLAAARAWQASAR